MATQKQRVLYANLMDEAKARIEVINGALRGQTGFPVPIVRELCWLELRMLCELIALACLVAHGDLKSIQSHQTGKAYSADDIVKKLSQLRPHFFPLAHTIHRQPSGFTEIRYLEVQPLTKDDLLKLYGQCHKHLHRGTLKQLLSSEIHINMEINLPEIVGWGQKINDLLSVHTIAISEGEQLHCILRNPHDNNMVQVATSERCAHP